MGRRLYIVAILCTLCLGAASTAWAQRTRPDRGSIDSLLDEVHIHLGSHEREIADEYLDILDELQTLLDDYDTELEDLRDITNRSHDESLEHLRTELEAGRYADDPVQLTEDIETLIRDLKDIENEQKAVENTNNPRTTRVIRNLRRQLVMTIDLIEDYTDSHTQAIFQQRDVQLYLKEAMEHVAEALKSIPDSIDLARLKEDLRGVEIPIPGSFPVSPLPPTKQAVPPYMVIDTSSRNIPRVFIAGDVGSRRRLEDSLSVDEHLRVLVSNPSGGVEIIGWSEDLIQAELIVEVAASSRAKERDFLDEIALNLSRESGAYQVRAEFPKIDDPDTRVLRSSLSVRVPSDRPLECSNSFGTATVSDLDEGLLLRSQNSEVTVDNIGGGADIANSMGGVTVGEVEGKLRISNSYSPIVLYGCDGDIDITNDYALVKLTDNRGRVKIKNTGQTMVRSHEGDVFIENMYGVIDAVEIDGRLEASNSYSAINISDITDDVRVQNSYAMITAKDIGGLLAVSNTHGSIRIYDPENPIDLNSQNGDVELVYSSYSGGGNSQVVIAQGNLRLVIMNSPDLEVEVETNRGSISGNAGIQTYSSDGISSARLVYGDGDGRLVINGDRTNIIIEER